MASGSELRIEKESSPVRLFVWVFAALNLVFLYYQSILFIGNHDWDWVKGTTQVLQWNTGLFEGRYGKFILNVTLFGGQILPLLNSWVAFALLAVGTTMLACYWSLKNFSSRLLVALLPALAPFILGWLYFPINILGNFMSVPAGIGGLMLIEKKGYLPKIAGVGCFLLALGVYPSVAEMLLVCWGFRCLLAEENERKQAFQALFWIVGGLVLFMLVLKILAAAGIVYTGHYNMQTASISEIINRLPNLAALAVGQLAESLPFLPSSLKACGLLLIIVAFALSWRSEAPKSVIAALWVIILGATVLSAALAAMPEEVAYMPRVNFYGLNFLYAGAAAVLLSDRRCFRNLGLMLGVVFLMMSVNQNMEAQKVWQLGKIAEEKLVERISARISEKHPESSLLIPVLTGEISLRPRYYHAPYRRPSPYVLNTSFIVRHIPSGMFNFYATVPLFAGMSRISAVSPALRAFINETSRPWPAESSLFVDENYAVIMLTPEGIAAIRAQLPR